MLSRLALGASLAAAIAAPVFAQSSGDPKAGRAFAESVCADCHIVDPEPKVLSADKPRAFIEIAQDAKFTESALRIFLRTPHDQMPDFILSKTQTDDIVAYFLQLRAAK